MRLKRIFIVLLIFFSCNFSVVAATPQWGIGAVIGDPTGLSINYFMNEIQSLHSVLSFDFNGSDELNFASHFTRWKRFSDTPLNPLRWFYGLAAEIAILDQVHKGFHDTDVELGPSATLGISYAFESAPLEVFLNSNLTLNVIQKNRC